MLIDLHTLLRTTRMGRAQPGSNRRRRGDRAARWTAPPSPYSSGFVNELGAWCGVERAPSARDGGYVWIPWDTTGQIRRLR